MLEITNLHKQYKDFELDHISFQLPKGFIMGLVGKNGAGKSTTIKSIMNMLDFQGQIRIDGQDNILCEKRVKQMVGVVVDQPFFPVIFTLEQVEKYCGSFYVNWDKDNYDKLLRQLGLNPKKKVSELSRGMGVKLQLAVALSHKAELLVLDEPTSGLDPVARDECMDILMEYIQNGDHSVLFSTHISTDLEKIADYITILSGGKLFYTGEKDVLMEKYVILKGDQRKVSEELEKNLIGARRYGDSFEAMLPREQYALCDGCPFQTENAKIDDILIYAERSA
ncbi:MAG: ABC transporter ATP-binding protein [Lachnospiraceae bacterium]|nr:ABC transporter ATP-binding protein [Lachnospiraceae bacterium]MDE7240217.1 ABC transporter ATP-binding protein [Lachnospiraceae bacterium]